MPSRSPSCYSTRDPAPAYGVGAPVGSSFFFFLPSSRAGGGLAGALAAGGTGATRSCD